MLEERIPQAPSVAVLNDQLAEEGLDTLLSGLPVLVDSRLAHVLVLIEEVLLLDVVELTSLREMGIGFLTTVVIETSEEFEQLLIRLESSTIVVLLLHLEQEVIVQLIVT